MTDIDRGLATLAEIDAVLLDDEPTAVEFDDEETQDVDESVNDADLYGWEQTSGPPVSEAQAWKAPWGNNVDDMCDALYGVEVEL